MDDLRVFDTKGLIEDMKNEDSPKPDMKESIDYTFGFIPFLEMLSDEGFLGFKNRLIKQNKRFVHPVENHVAYELFDILCKQGKLLGFTRLDIARVLDALIPESAQSAHELQLYALELVALVDFGIINNINGKDAEELQEHLIHNLILQCRECIRTKEKEETVLTLVDIFKVVSCLCQANIDKVFRFEVNMRKLDYMGDRLTCYYVDKYNTSKEYFRPVIATETENSNHETCFERLKAKERHSVLLCWLLEEILIDQDGIARGGEINVS